MKAGTANSSEDNQNDSIIELTGDKIGKAESEIAMTKQDILNELKGLKGIKVKFYTKSPYQKRRYKPEYVESEAWIYTPATTMGYLITTETFDNIEHRKEFFDIIREENKCIV